MFTAAISRRIRPTSPIRTAGSPNRRVTPDRSFCRGRRGPAVAPTAAVQGVCGRWRGPSIWHHDHDVTRPNRIEDPAALNGASCGNNYEKQSLPRLGRVGGPSLRRGHLLRGLRRGVSRHLSGRPRAPWSSPMTSGTGPRRLRLSCAGSEEAGENEAALRHAPRPRGVASAGLLVAGADRGGRGEMRLPSCFTTRCGATMPMLSLLCLARFRENPALRRATPTNRGARPPSRLSRNLLSCAPIK